MSAQEKSERRRSIAYAMYCAGDSHEVISDHVGVTSATVQSWVTKYGWRTGKSVVNGEMEMEAAIANDQRIRDDIALQNSTLSLKAAYESFQRKMSVVLDSAATELEQQAATNPRDILAQSRNVLQITQAAERIFPEMKPGPTVSMNFGDPSKIEVKVVEIPGIDEIIG